MRRRSTIRDVAREAGVSVAVVSRVLNDGTGPVAPQTRARVVEVIERLGFQPRAAARELQQQSTTTIGLVLADLANPFFARLADRVVWEARARGIHAVLLTNQEDPHLEGESLDTLLGRSVGSVIATPTGGNVDKWRRLITLGVNIVFVDREIDELPGVDVVAINNELSAETATQHMLGLGHERIAFISGPLSTSTGRDRVAGFRKAMAAAGTEVDERLIHAIPFRGDSGGDAVSALLALPDSADRHHRRQHRPGTQRSAAHQAVGDRRARRPQPDRVRRQPLDRTRLTAAVGRAATDRHARAAFGRTRRRPAERCTHRTATTHPGQRRVRPAIEHGAALVRSAEGRAPWSRRRP